MKAAGPAGQDITRPGTGAQQRERTIEVEEILPGPLDYRDGQGRAFHAWTVTRASKYGLGKLSEAQLRELGRQIGHLLGASAGPEGDGRPGGTHEAAAAGPAESPAVPAAAVTSEDTRDPASRERAESGPGTSD